jgi:hypothetical protein
VCIALLVFVASISGIFSWQLYLKRKEVELLKEMALVYSIEQGRMLLKQELTQEKLKQLIETKKLLLYEKELALPFLKGTTIKQKVTCSVSQEPKTRGGHIAYLLHSNIETSLDKTETTSMQMLWDKKKD